MKPFLTYILLLFVLCSCKERIDISTDNAVPQLVITGYITTDTMAHVVTIAQTIAYFGVEKPKTYNNALVSINGKPLHALGGGRYSTDADFFGEPGKTYLLDVYVDKDNNGNPQHYTAVTTMPPMHTLDSITLHFFRNYNGYPMWTLYVHFQDIANVPNLFGAHLYINSIQYSNKLRRYFLSNFDEGAADGQYIHFPLFPYTIHHDMRWNVRDEPFKIYTGDTLTVELNMLERTYFNYIQAAKSEVAGSNPLFAGPPANVPGNIQGGALGIFGAYTTSRQNFIITKQYGLPEK